MRKEINTVVALELRAVSFPTGASRADLEEGEGQQAWGLKHII